MCVLRGSALRSAEGSMGCQPHTLCKICNTMGLSQLRQDPFYGRFRHSPAPAGVCPLRRPCPPKTALTVSVPRGSLDSSPDFNREVPSPWLLPLEGDELTLWLSAVVPLPRGAASGCDHQQNEHMPPKTARSLSGLPYECKEDIYNQ